MQNWHRYAISIGLALVIGAGARFIQPDPTLVNCGQAAVAAMLPALISLRMTLDKQ